MTSKKSHRFFKLLNYCLKSLTSTVLVIVLSLFLTNSDLFAQPNITWENTIGGTGYDELRCLQGTSDGGMILACTSPSSELTSTDITEPSNGAGDYWIVNVNPDGTVAWDRRIGGSDFESAQEIQATSDGGFIIGGFSRSNASGDKSANNFGPSGTSDMWVTKLNSLGDIEWEESYGGMGDEELYHIQETSDGGFILGGYSSSGISGTKTAQNFGEQDFYVIKIDASGTQLWDQSFGGSVRDVIQGLDEGPDGSFYFGGYSESDNDGNKTDPTFSPGRSDYWVVKTDANGNKIWDKAFGGDSWDQIRNIKVISEGNIILGGFSKSGISGNKTTETFGLEDMWVIKLNPDGTVLWQRNYGGELKEECTQVSETTCGELLLGGFSRSPISGNKTANLEGNHDYWIVKTDANGNKIWDESYGGDDVDVLYDFKRSSDGGYLLGGVSFSNGTGDRSEPSLGPQDVWMLKLDIEQTTMDSTFLTSTSCSPADTGIVVDYYINQFGCDSVVIDTVKFLQSDTTRIELTSCSPSDTSQVVNSLFNANGCDSLVFINTSLSLSYEFFSISSSCDPSSAGLDTLRFTTVDGCDSLIIQEVVLDGFDFEYQTQEVICFDGTEGMIIIDTVLGGMEPFMYSINNGAFGSENSFKGLSAGTYFVSTMDAEGCEVTKEIVIVSGQNFQIIFQENLSIPIGDSFWIDPIISHDIASFNWDQNIYLTCDTCLQQFVKPVTNTSFELNAVSIDGCSASGILNIQVNKSKNWYVPNAFSPNGDGKNDLFKIYFDNTVRSIEDFKIFDRWGSLVYEITDVNQFSNWGWDGEFNGQEIDPGVFVFIAQINFSDGTSQSLKGDVLLFR